jgi:isoquinoline 1-oxidoreductase beta subunit
VKLLWTREDDIRHDAYRAGGFHTLKAGIDAHGKLVALTDHYVTYGQKGKFASSAAMSATIFPAEFVPNLHFGASLIDLNTPTGPLRAPVSNAFGFVFQSFLDEVAHAAGRDPLEFHLDLLAERRARQEPQPPNAPVFDPQRMRNVLKLVAEKANWAAKANLPKGTGMGLAYYFSHRGYVAHIAQVTVGSDAAVKVDKVWVAADVGSHIVNPSGAENQVQGATIDGISQFMAQEITFARGGAVQGNFDNYPILRMKQASPVEVHFLKSDNPPTGLGEPAVPPTLPAVSNAIFAASGRRIRETPYIKAIQAARV